MALGLDGSLDDAFRSAMANMAKWLADDYKLTPSNTAQVLGTAAEYKVSEVVDRNAEVVLKINKDRLQSLTPRNEVAPACPRGTSTDMAGYRSFGNAVSRSKWAMSGSTERRIALFPLFFPAKFKTSRMTIRQQR
jgi:hypothetical protein